MAKFIYVCSRSENFNFDISSRLIAICKKLAPDNLTRANSPIVSTGKGVAYAITDDTGGLDRSQHYLSFGGLVDGREHNMHLVGSGSSSSDSTIFRADAHTIEIISDSSGSRTVWYFHDAHFFIASTSQRAIVMFLGIFNFNKGVIPWMISTGSLGPELSWDSSLKRLRPDSVIRVSRQTWVLNIQERPITFQTSDRTRSEHKKLLAEALYEAILPVARLDLKRWVLPLSGGYDSRAILCFLKHQNSVLKELTAITWGLRESLEIPGNDAKVAKELAADLRVNHRYCTTDISSEQIDQIIDRFLLCGEGRIDHLAGYMDGMEIWRLLHAEGIDGVIRGDEGFGWVPSESELEVRLSIGCALCTDFKNLKNISRDFKLPKQDLSPKYARLANETIALWRDRLYHEFRIPTVLAALSDIKLAYVELVNPLLAKSILQTVRTEPDELRTNKTLFKEIVQEISPSVPFATVGANASLKDILRNDAIVNLMKRVLGSRNAIELLGEGLCNFVLAGVKTTQATTSVRKRTIRDTTLTMMPAQVKRWMKHKVVGIRLDSNVLAFRIFMVVRMHELLTADANCIDSLKDA